MDVKIMSMQRVVNYGSFMQAYALMKTIEGLGANVSFVDFRWGKPAHKGKKVAVPTLKEKALKIPSAIANAHSQLEKRLFHRRLHNEYQRASQKHLRLGKDENFDYNCDLMVIGSDEVFNYTQNHIWGYVPALFGHDIVAKHLISYAASAGYATLQDVVNDGMSAELCSGLRKFNALSVRDLNTMELVKGVSGIDATLVVDPTLLFDFNPVLEPIPARRPYLIVYAYEGRMNDRNEVRAIREFAEKKGLQVVSPGFYHDWVDENIVVTPFQLLSFFKNASYVITDTFHGSIFSIKFSKPFISFVRRSSSWGTNAGKLEFLLEQLGLSDRIVQSPALIDSMLEKSIDFPKVHSRITELAESSRDFIVRQLDSAMGKR